MNHNQMVSSGWQTFDPPRELTENERNILRGLARSASVDEREVAMCQVEHVRVEAEARGECGSLALVVDRATCNRLPQDRGFVSNAESFGSGPRYHVLLHVRSGYIHTLEAYRTDGEPCDKLPEASVLTFLGG